MPIQTKWSDFTKENVSNEKENLGIYELGNSNDILYIGKGIIRDRLIVHLPNGQDPMPGTSKYRKEYTNSQRIAEQRERAELGAYEKENGRLPKYNKRRG